MLPRKILENLGTVMTHSVVFEQFSGKFSLNVLPLISICACFRLTAYCYRIGLKSCKNCI